jgi:hypothetical protein
MRPKLSKLASASAIYIENQHAMRQPVERDRVGYRYPKLVECIIDHRSCAGGFVQGNGEVTGSTPATRGFYVLK